MAIIQYSFFFEFYEDGAFTLDFRRNELYPASAGQFEKQIDRHSVMDTGSVQVRRVEVTREEIRYDHPTAGPEIAEALKALGELVPARLPLAKEKVVIELSGVPTAVANALRRAAKDEIRGCCLTFDPEGFDYKTSTDPFMDENFVRTRLRMIPLCPQIPGVVIKELRFGLDVANHTGRVMMIYSGDLHLSSPEASAPAEPLFNPTHEIGFLQPGCTLHIHDIHLTEGYGTQDAAFIVAVRAVTRPLDLGELSLRDTHSFEGGASSQSGFVESSLTSNPRHHEVSMYIPAAPPGGRAALTVLVDACGEIMQRLRLIQKTLEAARLSGGGGTQRAAKAYFLVTSDASRVKGILGVRDETDTIGNLLARSIYELMPDIGYVSYTCIPHEKMMKLTVAHAVSEPEEINQIVARATRHAYGIFSQIQRGIRLSLV